MYKGKTKYSILLIPIGIFLFLMQPLSAQMTIDTIIIEQKKSSQMFPDSWKYETVGNPSQADIIHLSGLKIGQEAGEFEWKKAEEALRTSQIFSKVHIEIDTLDARNVTVYIVHELALPKEGPGLYVDIGGSIASLGGIYDTKNLSGSLIDLHAQALNRTEHGIGPALIFSSNWKQIMQSRISLGIGFHYHQFTQGFSVQASMSPHPMGGAFAGASLKSQEGIDFLFENASTQRISQTFQEYSVWGGWLLPRKDNLYCSAKASIREANRGSIKTIQAFDNTQSILLGFGSLADRTRISNGDGIPIGAWGSAVLGKIMPSSQRNEESYYYVGGLVEQSELTLNNALYLRATLSAGSGLLRGNAINTALEATTKAQYLLHSSCALMVNAMIRASWNWNDFRQLILDNQAGIRGMPVNARIGNNVAIVNVMLAKEAWRLIPGLRLGFSAFVDMGSVWNKGVSLAQTVWTSSIGGGLLILAEGRSMQIGKPLLRIEYAHVLQGGNGIVLSTQYPFTMFTSHQYATPCVIGDTIDTE
ncbi:MAG: hypothetical protein ACKO2H_08240 [Bacteroidota bacterium]